MTDDVQRFREQIRRPDNDIKQAALERQLQLTKPAGALGRLEDLSCWLAAVQDACPPRPLTRARVVIFAGDHGVAQAGVSAYPPEVTAQMVSNFVSGGAAINALARALDASVRVVDMSVNVTDPTLPAEVTRLKVRQGSGNIAVEDALTPEETLTAFRAGIALADEEIDAGADILIPGDMGIANTTPGRGPRCACSPTKTPLRSRVAAPESTTKRGCERWLQCATRCAVAVPCSATSWRCWAVSLELTLPR